mgnify:CR=1 FL=1
MSIRLRILAAAVLLAVGPLAAAIATIRPGVADDVTELDTRRVETRLQQVLDTLERRNGHLATLLDALAGTIAANGSHLHASLADASGVVQGGHLAYGCLVRTTAEVLLGLLPGLSFRREPDLRTGFAELVVRPEEGPAGPA